MRMKKAAALLLAGTLLLGDAGQMTIVQAATIDSAKQKDKELKNKKSNAEKEQKALRGKLDKIIGDLKKAEEDVDRKELQISKAEDEVVAAQIKENRQYERMKIRIKYMYENGSPDMMQVLLTAESMADFLNKAEYVEQISTYDREMLVEFQKIVEEVKEKEAALQREKKQLLGLQQNLQKKQSEVQSLLKANKSRIADLEKEIGNNAKVLQELIRKAKEAERRRKEAEAAERRRIAEEKRRAEEKKRQEQAAANKRPAAGSSSKPSGGSSSGAGASAVSGSGFLSNPCPAARISSEYGPRKAPVPGASTFHEGRDYAAPSGTGIYAAADGRVIRTGYQAVRGNYVVVDHGNGIVTWYQHCTSVFVSQGQTVSRGQNIATVGATGRVSGPHLHFIVEANGRLVDPRKYL